MAEAFAMLDSEVVLVEGAERLLPQEEAEASVIVEASLAARGVTVITGTGIESVGRSSVGVELRLAGRTIKVDEVLLAAGRTPNTEGLVSTNSERRSTPMATLRRTTGFAPPFRACTPLAT